MKSHAAMRLLILLCLGRALGITPNDDGVFGRKKYPLSTKHNQQDRDENMIRRIEEEMLALNKSGELPRDKRALGILLQGFMEALGYTVSPIQLGSLPNPTAAAQMPAPAAAAAPPTAGMMPAPPMGMPPMMMMGNGSAAPPTPRQRETVRFTGVLNFGNNVNTSNLVTHLAQYEQLFHGNRTAAPPAAPSAAPSAAPAPSGPPPAPKPSIDPRSQPLPEPLFVKIPLPIVPNLPPPQPPSPMPIENTYQEEYTKDHEEEYHGDKDDSERQGNHEDEEDAHQYNEEYENNHEKYDEPEDRNYEYKPNEDSIETNSHDHDDNESEPESPPPVTTVKPQEKTTEKEYKKNENVVNYSVESKEIHDPSEVAEEAPLVGSKFNHAMYVGEPNWKKEHEDHLYRLAAEREAQAEALAEENAEREKNRDRDHELAGENKEFHASREKEISDRNEELSASYEEDDEPTEKPYYDDDDKSGEPDKESYSDSRNNSEDEDEDYKQETKVSERPSSLEASTQIPKKEEITTKADARKYENYHDDGPRQYNKNYYNEDEKKTIPPVISYTTTLPISYDREKVRQGDPLRDSYGQNLEKPGGKVDERVAGYFTMFKNPQTGVYDPTIIQQFGSPVSASYDNSDLVSGFQKIQKEYGRPESKYEEYEIKDDDDYGSHDDSRPEHRKLPAEELKHIGEPSSTTECDCSKETRRPDGHTEEARSPGHTVPTSLPPPTKLPDASVSYGPYYSTVNHLYDPLSNDQGIIARLTSYSPPTTQRFETRTDLVQNPSFSTVHRQYQQTYSPTVVTLPERVTAQSILQETEVKQIRAWPAPFDYVYDNSEHSDVVHRGSQHPTRQTLFEPIKPDCYHQSHSLPLGKDADRVHKMLRQANNDRFDLPSSARPTRRPDNSRDSRKVKPGAHPTMRVNIYAPTTTQPTIWDSRKRPITTERPAIRHHQHHRTYPSIPETLTPHPGSLLRSSVRNPVAFNNQFFRRQDQNPRQSNNRQVSRTKPTAKKKHQVKDESSNYVEKDGMLIIPEPTPYYYNERIEEFTDEPLLNGEKIKIKEYRNRIASVKVSELKQQHPEGSSQIVQYSRHL
ncbi:hypothetical protein TSAR_007237 [Trichomalopsis sarcophagae]|uniref:Zasp-like motif domain-containing protein n=1 Tax=Trichomalopsis sarcophagae TaxID=543379 RepID=A0A232F1R3_9HYME|nr:hypothetical protein TSAR_007237 [Trichomalopsis sarcophagae]